MYSRRAKNRDLEIDAAEIRIRAERKYGQMLAELKRNGHLRDGRPKKTVDSDQPFFEVSLKEIGATKDFSHKTQKLAAVPEDEFEEMLGDWREKSKKANEKVTVNLLKRVEATL